MHPIASVLNHGIPVCLCSDDPSAFGNLGLSFDFYQVLVSSEQTGLITLGEIALDSLKVGYFSSNGDHSMPLTMVFLSTQLSKQRKRNGRSRCGRRGGRSFWSRSLRPVGICRLPLAEIESSGCVHIMNGGWYACKIGLGCTQFLVYVGGYRRILTTSHDRWGMMNRYLIRHYYPGLDKARAPSSRLELRS